MTLPTFPMTPELYWTTDWPTDEPDENGRLSFVVECRNGTCGLVHEVRIDLVDLMMWRDGAFVQDAMPYLTEDERELLISRTCGTCFDALLLDESEA